MSNIPKLRFPEFTDAWEKWELNKIAIKVTEKNKDGIFPETLTNSAEFGVISQRDFFDKDISNPENLNGYYIVKPNDFVYNPRISNLAPVGPIKRNQLNRIGIMSPLYFIFRVSSNIDLDFLDAFFSTNLWHLFMKLNGDSGARADRIAIKDKIFMEMSIPLPSYIEQQKIGNLFKQLDRLITLHKRKWDDVILLKKALLQKMFPKNGSDFPEIRFPEFTDAWEKCKLGEILIENLKPVDKPQNGYTRLGLRSHMKGTFHEEVEAGKGLDVDTMYEVEENNLILNITFAWEMAIAITNSFDKGKLVSHRFPQYKFSQGYSPDFFYYSIDNKKFKENLLLASPGGAGRNRVLKKSEFLKIEKKFPKSLDEQQKIGNLFKQLDRLITLHKRQHEHYQLLKKALLQQMFV